MSYRAIDLDRKDLVLYCANCLDELIDSIDLKVRQADTVKNNTTHLYISMCYLRAILALYLLDELMFVSNLNNILHITRVTEDKKYLSSSYFTVVLVHKIIACYIDSKFLPILYEESFNLSQDSYKNHTSSMCNVRIGEFSKMMNNLTSLRALTLDKVNSMRDFFISSLRSSQKSLLFNNFNKLNKSLCINVLGVVALDKRYINLFRDQAVLFEKKGDIDTAYLLMNKALEQRPDGPFIIEKVKEYKLILKLS